jgi:hypothetical protein
MWEACNRDQRSWSLPQAKLVPPVIPEGLVLVHGAAVGGTGFAGRDYALIG